MAEIIKVGEDREPPQYTNHVLIRLTENGTYQASGACNADGVPEYLLTRHFTNLSDVMKAALQWADAREIKIIHVDEACRDLDPLRPSRTPDAGFNQER